MRAAGRGHRRGTAGGVRWIRAAWCLQAHWQWFFVAAASGCCVEGCARKAGVQARVVCPCAAWVQPWGGGPPPLRLSGSLPQLSLKSLRLPLPPLPVSLTQLTAPLSLHSPGFALN
jgi:hypothetical protein